MEYCLRSSGNSFVMIDPSGRICLTTNKKKAAHYNKMNKHKLFHIRENIPKSLKRHAPFEIVLYEENFNTIKSELLAQKENNEENIKIKIDSLSSDLNNIVNCKPDLVRDLSRVDTIISDLLHYIEFYKFSACEGYKLCKSLQAVLDERREIKNQLKLIRAIQSDNACINIVNGKVLKTMEHANEQKYEPRILVELFDKNQQRIRTK